MRNLLFFVTASAGFFLAVTVGSLKKMDYDTLCFLQEYSLLISIVFRIGPVLCR